MKIIEILLTETIILRICFNKFPTQQQMIEKYLTISVKHLIPSFFDAICKEKL